MSTSLHSFHRASCPSAPPCRVPLVDILVLHAATLIGKDQLAQTIERILDITLCSARSRPQFRGPWLLVTTHNRREREQAYQLTLALSTRCQGIRAVTEQNRTLTEQAALALHRLHFPAVLNRDRPSRILHFGSSRMEALFPRPAQQDHSCTPVSRYS